MIVSMMEKKAILLGRIKTLSEYAKEMRFVREKDIQFMRNMIDDIEETLDSLEKKD